MRKISFVIVAFILFACEDNKKAERPNTPRIKKETKIISPQQNQKFIVGDKISFEIKATNLILDSIRVEMDGTNTLLSEDTFDIKNSSTKVGSKRIKTTIFFNGESETHHTKIIFLPKEPPIEYGYEVINSYPHNKEDYTQGLLISEGFLFESTGQNGSSTVKKKNIKSGETLNQVNLSDDFFGEGLALINGLFYQLTYRENVCFVYDATFEKVSEFSYSGEGWGICAYNGNLLMTNSTEKIVIRDPKTFSILDEFEVYDNTGKVDAINELEIIDGMIYANVYLEDYIVVIDPETGTVIRKIDMTGLLKSEESEDVDVLNGIAYNQTNDRIYVTGKWWPKLFEVKFVPKNLAQ